MLENTKFLYFFIMCVQVFLKNIFIIIIYIYRYNNTCIYIVCIYIYIYIYIYIMFISLWHNSNATYSLTISYLHMHSIQICFIIHNNYNIFSQLNFWIYLKLYYVVIFIFCQCQFRTHSDKRTQIKICRSSRNRSKNPHS